MNIWFYISLITFLIIIILITKIILIKKSLKDIQRDFNTIIKSDTNNLITLSTNDKDIKELTKFLNDSLKTIRKLRIEYENGNQEIKTAITNVTHDLRTPLTAIKGYLDLININKNNQEYILVLKRKTEELINLTDQLFYYTKTLDLQTINKENVCLNEILEDAIIDYYDLLKAKNIIPSINIYHQKIYKYLDKEMLKRIFNNIISNAIKYSEKDLKITLDKTGKITFSNHTKNLNKITVEKIFNRYYTVANNQKSTGVGLSIAKHLIELNNGKINATYTNNILTITIAF